jgi:hypothetical protein
MFSQQAFKPEVNKNIMKEPDDFIATTDNLHFWVNGHLYTGDRLVCGGERVAHPEPRMLKPDSESSSDRQLRAALPVFGAYESKVKRSKMAR